MLQKHLPDNVSEEEKYRRLNELIRLQTEISAEQTRKTRERSLIFLSSALVNEAVNS